MPAEVRVPLARRQDHRGLRRPGPQGRPLGRGQRHPGAEHLRQLEPRPRRAAVLEVRPHESAEDLGDEGGVGAGRREGLPGADQPGGVGLGWERVARGELML